MVDEHSLNSNLAEILRKAGIKAEPQVPFQYGKGDRRVADLVCRDFQVYTIGIAAKLSWGNKLKANKKASIRQAEELVFNKAKRNFCDAAIGLIYPDSYKNQDHLQTGKVEVAVRTPLDVRKQNQPEGKERSGQVQGVCENRNYLFMERKTLTTCYATESLKNSDAQTENVRREKVVG